MDGGNRAERARIRNIHMRMLERKFSICTFKVEVPSIVCHECNLLIIVCIRFL